MLFAQCYVISWIELVHYSWCRLQPGKEKNNSYKKENCGQSDTDTVHCIRISICISNWAHQTNELSDKAREFLGLARRLVMSTGCIELQSCSHLFTFSSCNLSWCVASPQSPRYSRSGIIWEGYLHRKRQPNLWRQTQWMLSAFMQEFQNLAKLERVVQSTCPENIWHPLRATRTVGTCTGTTQQQHISRKMSPKTDF